MKVCKIEIELGGKDKIHIEIIDVSNEENQGLSQVTVTLGQKSEYFTVSPHDNEVFKSGILTDPILDIISQIWKLPSTEEVRASVTKQLADFWRFDPQSPYIVSEVDRIMKDQLPPYNENKI